jgi:hypothetical protein
MSFNPESSSDSPSTDTLKRVASCNAPALHVSTDVNFSDSDSAGIETMITNMHIALTLESQENAERHASTPLDPPSNAVALNVVSDPYSADSDDSPDLDLMLRNTEMGLAMERRRNDDDHDSTPSDVSSLEDDQHFLEYARLLLDGDNSASRLDNPDTLDESDLDGDGAEYHNAVEHRVEGIDDAELEDQASRDLPSPLGQ